MRSGVSITARALEVIRESIREWREGREEARSFRALSPDEQMLVRLSTEARAQVMDTGVPVNPEEAVERMRSLHGDDLLSIHVDEAIVTAKIRGGRLLRYDALYRLLDR